MKSFSVIFFIVHLFIFQVAAQTERENFTLSTVVKHFPVLDQGNTGTCWSFATVSFLESEITRKGFPDTNLSEMFFVYHAHRNRAFKYLLYHGNNNLGEGGLSHDVMDVLREHGMVTYEAYPGLQVNNRFNHRELIAEVRSTANELNKSRNGFTAGDIENFNTILNKHIGEPPAKILTHEGEFTPIEFRDKFGIDPDDYVELTSYNHHPLYKPFVLEVPDNWAHALYYNLPIDELMEVMYYALENDYTISWDGDTSERTFSHRNGLAELPRKLRGKVDQAMRQETFYNRTTTDDHLMHIVGISEDNEGRTCFYTKNSWGAGSNEYGGYLHMTEDYVRLKTIAIMVNKEAIPQHIRQKLDF